MHSPLQLQSHPPQQQQQQHNPYYSPAPAAQQQQTYAPTVGSNAMQNAPAASAAPNLWQSAPAPTAAAPTGPAANANPWQQQQQVQHAPQQLTYQQQHNMYQQQPQAQQQAQPPQQMQPMQVQFQPAPQPQPQQPAQPSYAPQAQPHLSSNMPNAAHSHVPSKPTPAHPTSSSNVHNGPAGSANGLNQRSNGPAAAPPMQQQQQQGNRPSSTAANSSSSSSSGGAGASSSGSISGSGNNNSNMATPAQLAAINSMLNSTPPGGPFNYVPPASTPSAADPLPQTLFGNDQFTEEESARIQLLLERKLAAEEMSTRTGGGKAKMYYVEAHSAINFANYIFDYNGWSSSIKEFCMDYMEDKGGRWFVGLSCIVRIMLKDGSYHEDVGYGSCANMPDRGAALEKAKKEASSDALKRALRLFGNGLGNCIYDKEYLNKIAKGQVIVQPLDLSANRPRKRQRFMPLTKEEIRAQDAAAAAAAASASAPSCGPAASAAAASATGASNAMGAGAGARPAGPPPMNDSPTINRTFAGGHAAAAHSAAAASNPIAGSTPGAGGIKKQPGPQQPAPMQQQQQSQWSPVVKQEVTSPQISNAPSTGFNNSRPVIAAPTLPNANVQPTSSMPQGLQSHYAQQVLQHQQQPLLHQNQQPAYGASSAAQQSVYGAPASVQQQHSVPMQTTASANPYQAPQQQQQQQPSPQHANPYHANQSAHPMQHHQHQHQHQQHQQHHHSAAPMQVQHHHSVAAPSHSSHTSHSAAPVAQSHWNAAPAASSTPAATVFRPAPAPGTATASAAASSSAVPAGPAANAATTSHSYVPPSSFVDNDLDDDMLLNIAEHHSPQKSAVNNSVAAPPALAATAVPDQTAHAQQQPQRSVSRQLQLDGDKGKENQQALSNHSVSPPTSHPGSQRPAHVPVQPHKSSSNSSHSSHASVHSNAAGNLKRSESPNLSSGSANGAAPIAGVAVKSPVLTMADLLRLDEQEKVTAAS